MQRPVRREILEDVDLTPDPQTPLGQPFYDEPGVFGRYMEHRGKGVFSPNTVMEEPTVREHLGDVAGLRVLDLGCGDAALGLNLLGAGCESYLGVDRVVPVLEACHRWLSPGGRIVITVVHPVITSYDAGIAGRARTSWEVDDYFLPGPRTRLWMGSSVVWHHRTIQDYVQALLDCGFTLTAISECPPRADLLGNNLEELSRRRRTPLFLLLAATRGS